MPGAEGTKVNQPMGPLPSQSGWCSSGWRGGSEKAMGFIRAVMKEARGVINVVHGKESQPWLRVRVTWEGFTEAKHT